MAENQSAGRDLVELMDRATENANRYAPKPAYEPIIGGITGMTITGFVLAVFSGIAGLDPDRHATAQAITIALGFLIPFGYLKYQQKLHYDAWAVEYKRLQDENAAQT